MPGAVIKKGAKVKYAIIAEDVVVEENAVVGEDPSQIPPEDFGITVIGSGVKIGKGVKIGAKEMITEDVTKEEA
jgi:glucose-1-phosphate adenylyltransferase